MTLLIVTFAAIFSTFAWYKNIGKEDLKLGTLASMYWGGILMWSCDAVAEYVELGASYFTPDFATMLNDSFLGISVVAVGLLIWLVMLLIKDPQGKIRSILTR